MIVPPKPSVHEDPPPTELMTGLITAPLPPKGQAEPTPSSRPLKPKVREQQVWWRKRVADAILNPAYDNGVTFATLVLLQLTLIGVAFAAGYVLAGR